MVAEQQPLAPGVTRVISPLPCPISRIPEGTFSGEEFALGYFRSAVCGRLNMA